MGSENIALIGIIWSVESVRVRGNRGTIKTQGGSDGEEQ